MSTLATVQLVMSREIRQRLRSRGFIILTALLCVGIIGIGILNRVLGGNDAVRYDVAVVGQAPPGLIDVAQQIGQSLNIDVREVHGASRTAAEQAVRDGRIDAFVDASTGELVSKSTPPEKLATTLTSAWQAAKSREAAKAAGLDDQQIKTVLSPAPLTTTVLKDNNRDNTVGAVVGTATAILLFISINAFGGMVLTGVVEEKTTGVVEVLLSQVRAFQLLTGKVLGIGVVAMMQFAAALAAGLVALRISGTTVPGAVWIGLPTTLLWFVFGFVFYSTLYALAGSFVSRQEDAQGAAAPISIVFTAAYIAVFALGANPYSPVARIVSILPPFAPLLMPLRVSTGAASVAEIIVAAVLLVAATIGMLKLASGVYARTLLHRGTRLKWGEALRMRNS